MNAAAARELLAARCAAVPALLQSLLASAEGPGAAAGARPDLRFATASSPRLRFVTTGIGTSEGPARLLAYLLREHAGAAARFVPLSALAGAALTPLDEVGDAALVLFSQGLSPNAQLALAQAGRFAALLVYTSVLESDPRVRELRARGAVVAVLPPGPPGAAALPAQTPAQAQAPEQAPWQVPEQAPQQTPEQASAQTPEQASAQTPERASTQTQTLALASEQASERASEQTHEQVPERAPEQASAQTPAQAWAHSEDRLFLRVLGPAAAQLAAAQLAEAVAVRRGRGPRLPLAAAVRAAVAAPARARAALAALGSGLVARGQLTAAALSCHGLGALWRTQPEPTLAFVTSGGYGELGLGLRWKFLEGAGLSEPRSWDVLQVAHGPFQQTFARPLFLCALTRGGCPVEQALLGRLQAMLPPHHVLLQLPAEPPGPLSIFSHDLACNELLLALLPGRDWNLVDWPGRCSDGPLYQLADGAALLASGG